jgi:hypothetical protein
MVLFGQFAERDTVQCQQCLVGGDDMLFGPKGRLNGGLGDAV